MAPKIQVVGLIRFSLPTVGSFDKRFDTLEDTRDYLYAKERMALRFRLFEALTLRTLAAQSDMDFKCIILVGDGMPQDFGTKLMDLIEPHPWAAVVAMPPLEHYAAIKKAFSKVDRSGYTHRVTFRLDDDDAVDTSYIARLKDVSERVLHVQDTDPTAIAFNKGFYLSLRHEGPEVFDAVERTPLSVGAALIARTDYEDNIYCKNHRALGQFFNTYTDTKASAYIRTIHNDNKSVPTFTGRTRLLEDTEIDRRLRKHFDMSLTDLMSV